MNGHRHDQGENPWIKRVKLHSDPKLFDAYVAEYEVVEGLNFITEGD